jgi:hypothetical protein
MNPETRVACLIDGVIGCTGKIALQVIDQHMWIRWLRKVLMFEVVGQIADAPTFLMNIHADINVLTSEIKFAKVIHGKSPFGVFLSALT